jgi:uncharacterized DUF497 family protein
LPQVLDTGTVAIEFEWDLEKARINLAKHGVDFKDVCHAILDPWRMEDVDDRFDYGEERIQIIGACFGAVLFVVTVSHVQNHYRIISARPANPVESKRYFRGA